MMQSSMRASGARNVKAESDCADPEQGEGDTCSTASLEGRGSREEPEVGAPDFARSPTGPEAVLVPRRRAEGPGLTLTRRIWNLDWAKVLPPMIDDIEMRCGTFDDVAPFVRDHYPSIFGVDQDRFLVEEMTEAKARFCDEMDVFEFRFEGKTVGMCTGHPSDWSTYYIRTLAVLPEFRERRFATHFGDVFVPALAGAGVARLEGDCSVANRAMSKLFLTHGFVVTSTLTSERWGAMLRFTKFLMEDAQRVFHRQFVNVPSYGRNSRHQQERREP